MGSANPLLESDKKFYSIDDANRALPLVRAIVSDIVSQYKRVDELQQRLSRVRRDRKRKTDDVYAAELDQTRTELETEENRLRDYVDELRKLGVELKSEDGLCDFPSVRDGREIYLCWRLGEPQVAHWHELEAGFAGRRRITADMMGDRA